MSAETGHPALGPNDTALVLTQALPYIQRFRGKTVVVKYGGNAMIREDLARDFAADIVLMLSVGIRPVIVHGGGPQIGELMQRLGKEPEFVDGLRVTDAETLDIARMVLVGKVNRDIVSLINVHGPVAVGVSGEDAGLISATARDPQLGFVGQVEAVNPAIIDRLSAEDLVPVISTIGSDATGQAYNINADTVAGVIAESVGAEKLIVLTDVEGLTMPVVRAMIVIAELRLGRHLAGEQPTRQRHSDDDPDVAGYRFAEEQLGRAVSQHVEDDLYRRDTGVLDRLECLLDLFDAHAVVPQLAPGHHVVQRLEHLRPVVDLRRRAVELEQIQCLHVEIGPAAIDKRLDALSCVTIRRVGVQAASCLGRHHHPKVGSLGAKPSDQLLAAPVAVDIGGVVERDALVCRLMECSHGILFAHGPPLSADSPGTKPNGRDLESGSAQRAVMHGHSLRSTEVAHP